MYFSKRSGGAVFLDGDRDSYFSDAEIEDMLRGTVFLSSHSAHALAKRGFGDLLGVEAVRLTPDDPTPRSEKIFATGQTVQKQQHLMRLTPTAPETRVHSEVYTVMNGKERVPIFPGVTSYRNRLGGTTVVFAGRPLCNFVYHEAFSFLCESRKQQFIELLAETGHLPVYYPDDSEVYLKAANMSDGSLFVAFFNISLDPIDEITLVTERKVNVIEALCPDGSYRSINFRADDNKLTLDTRAEILTPVILILR
jgi:hypothetical protein